MSKKKLLTIVFGVLALGGGFWGATKLLKKEWPDRKLELAEAISKRLEQGAPSKEAADKAATCIAENLVPAAVEVECSAEGEVLDAMSKCINSRQEMQIMYMLSVPVCLKVATEQ